ncbi:MAG: MFS transporter [Opitutus sp.]|nr:MFS transporter [Opitutus sp.]
MLSRAWLTVGVLWVVAAFNYLDRLMITSMRDPIKADIAMSDAQFGLLTSVFVWVYGAFSPLGGFLADRFGRRNVILASLGVWSGVTWATGYMAGFPSLLAARALMGLSQACYVPAALALISDYHRGPTRSLATGIHMSGIYAGAALSGLGGFIAEHHGWRSGFVWFGACGLAYAVGVFFLLRDAPPEKPMAETTPANVRLSAALRALLSRTAFRILLVVTSLVGLANWAVYGWLPTYLKDHFSLGLGRAGLVATGYIQVASLFGVVLGGIWSDRWSRRHVRGRALVPAIGFCVAGPVLYFGINSTWLALAIVVLVFFGIARGFYDANQMPILRSVTDERYSATGYGVLNFVSSITGGAMIYVGGALKDIQIDLGRIFEFSAASLVCAGLLLFAIKPRSPVGVPSGLNAVEK